MNDEAGSANAVENVEVRPHLAVPVVASVPAALAGGMTGIGMTAGGEAELHPQGVRVGGAFLPGTTGRETTIGAELGLLLWMTARRIRMREMIGH